MGTMRIKDLKIEIGKPDVQEKVVEIEPIMAKIGPEFRGEAPKIVRYLQSTDPEEIAEILNKEGQISVEGSVLTWDYINSKKEVVGRTGEKVEILQSEELNAVLEVVRN